MKGPTFFFFLFALVIFTAACGIFFVFFPEYSYIVFRQIITHSALAASIGFNFFAAISWLWLKKTKLAYFCGFGGWLAAFQHDIVNVVSDGFHVLNFWLEALKANLF